MFVLYERQQNVLYFLYKNIWIEKGGDIYGCEI